MCTSPNFMFYEGEKEYVRPGESKYIWKFCPGGKNYNLVLEKMNPSAYVMVPCGKCLDCKLEYANQWADRCSIEAMNSPHNYFITLTYDENHLPAFGLEPRTMTLFIKRVRSHFKGVKIKYLYCGEYGGRTLRPHYHIIFFNLPLDDLTFQFITYESGKPVRKDMKANLDNMYSPTIHKLWHSEKSEDDILGNITVSRFTHQRAQYVARYCTGKIDRNLQEWYELTANYPEFIRMSQGIGGSQYDPKFMMLHDVYVNCGTGAVRNLPRYYEKLFKKDFGDLTPEMYQRRMKKRWDRFNTDNANNRNIEIYFRSRNYHLRKWHNLKSKV